MGGLKRAAKEVNRRTPALDTLVSQGFVPTQPGDPNFSLAETPGSQLQFPAAAAEKDIHGSRVRAQNQLNAAQAAGIDITSSKFDELQQVARQGFLERKRTLGESMLSWVGAPFEFVNLVIQDFVSPERNVTLLDYGNALWGGIEDDAEFTKRTGLTPRSFSETLTMFGWAPNDGEGFQPERILRGAVDFTGSVIIDPLTYLTGGLAGLGRKAALSVGRVAGTQVSSNTLRVVNQVRKSNPLAAADEMTELIASAAKRADVTDYERLLIRTHRQTMDDFGGVMKNHMDTLARGDLDDEVVGQLARYLKGTGKSTDDALDDLVRWYKGTGDASPLLEELALGNRISKELLRPLNQRNFAAIHPLALKELPRWSRGGLRIGVPAFSQRFANISVDIPGTRGLGKKAIGDPIREISKGLRALSPKRYGKMADAMKSGRLAWDQERPWLNGLRDGTLQPWQYNIGMAAFDNINNQSFRQGINASLLHHSNVLREAAEVAGEDESVVWGAVLRRLEQSGDEESLIRNIVEMSAQGGTPLREGVDIGFDPKVSKAANEAADYMREVMDDMHAQMSLLDPKFKEKYIDGYVNHSLNDNGRDIIGQFLLRGANIPEKQWAEAAARGEPGKGILVRLINAVGRGGMVETSLGSNRFIGRLLGRFQAQMLIDDGPVFWKINDLTDAWLRNASTPVIGPGGEIATDAVQTRYAGVDQLNEWLEAAVRGNAEEYGLVLPKNWDGKLFKEDPFEIVRDYVAAMDDTIKQWSMIDAMKMSGLVVRHSTAIDTQDVLQNIMANLYRVSEKLPSPTQAPSKRVIKEIADSPDDFVFHGTTAKSAAKILKGSFKEGGLTADQAAAQTFAVERRKVGGGKEVVLVFRKSELPPFAQRSLEKGDITDLFAGLDAGSIPAIKPVGSYPASEGIEGLVLREGGATIGDVAEQSVLKGGRDIIEGVPLKAVPVLRKAGLDPSDVVGTRKLYQTVEKATKEEFRSLRGEVDDFLPEAVGAGFNMTIDGDVPTLQFVVDSALSGTEIEALGERAILLLDDMFMTGDLKGKLNHETMMQLVENAPNNETSDLLHEYFLRKIASIGDKAREHLGKNPGEFTDSIALFSRFEAGINEFVADYTAKLTRSGELAQGGRQARQLAEHGGEFDQRLAALETAARDLKDQGYDEAVDIMRSVRDVTGVSDLPNYLSPHQFGLAGPAVEGMLIQRDMGLWLKNVSRNMSAVYTPEGVAAAKLATNNLLRTWRALATLPRPAFHIRNAIGAAWMNMSIGVRGETYARLSSNTLKWRKALRDGLENPFSVLDENIQEAWRAMVDEDVLAGFVASEARGRMTTAAKKERLDFLNVMDPDKFVATRVGGRVMESIEDIARAAAFLEYYQPGVKGSAIAARDVVHSVHFDYSNLTPLETKFKSFIPFFVWTRRNLPRQLEMMVERPALVQRYKHLMQAMNDNLGGQDDQGLPTGDMFGAYAAGTGFYVNPNTPFWARVMIDPDLPTSDLLTIPNLNPGEIGDFVNNLLGPHVSALIDINEQREFGDVNAPAGIGTILKGLAAIGMYDETLDGDVRIPYWTRTFQETALPFTRDLIDPFTGGPTDPNRQQRLGIAQDDSPLEAGLKNLLASLGRGVGIKFNTPVDVRGTAFRSQQELNKIIEDLRDEGFLPPSGG